jgi:hypothetical protein
MARKGKRLIEAVAYMIKLMRWQSSASAIEAVDAVGNALALSTSQQPLSAAAPIIFEEAMELSVLHPDR